MKNELNAFQWDDSVSEVDFFGEVATNPNKGVIPTAEIPEPDKEEKTTTKLGDDAKPEEPEIDFFGESNKDDKEANSDTDNDDTDEGSEEDKTDKGNVTESQTSVSTNVGVANFLKDKGFINFELEDGQELDENDAEQLIEDAWDESVEDRLEQTIAGLPETVKNLVKYAAKGGDVESYLSEISKTGSEGLSKNLDISKESNQEKFMRHKLAQEGNDEEFIDFQIESMKETGKLEALSTKAFNAWKKTQEDRDAQLVEEQNNRIKEAKRKALAFKKDIIKEASETKEFNGLKFNKQDTRELPEYITNASEEVNGKQTTPFYKDLGEALKDKQKVLVLAKLLKSNFSFKDIEKAAATKVAKDVKSNIQRQQQNNKDISTAGGSSQVKRLADYF